MNTAPVLELDTLSVRYRTGRGALRAVDRVSLHVGERETLGLVGESGCGKSSLAKAVLRLIEPEAGVIRVDGVETSSLSGRSLQPYRRLVQMVFQDPSGSLDPRYAVRRLVAEPLTAWHHGNRAKRRERVAALMRQVGLGPDLAERLPHELSGGQRQRVAIARALAPGPRLLVCDEPVSALDVSLQAQVLNLLGDLQAEFGIAYLFVSHDLSVVQQIADRVAVMYLGRVVEVARSADLWRRPAHPYTRALIEAVPALPPHHRRIADKTVLQGELPSPFNPPAGCRFHTRCSHVMPRCRTEPPSLRPVAPDHSVACHLHEPA
jgi:oligopeptide/dipeptide ABC transporter ATP-binding protein